jgi:hypothetical protein
MTSHQETRQLSLSVKVLVFGTIDILLVLGESNAISFITRLQGNTPKKIYSVFNFRIPILVGSHGGKCDVTKSMQGNVEDKTFIPQI